MDIVGVTGTNGKTTCVHMICNLLKSYLNCASFGTLGIKHYFNQQCVETPTSLTTLGNKELQLNLAKVADLGAQLVAMEVSSHGLVQNRVAGVKFVDAIFTNLSHDHLDYHKDMENYFQAKVKLFTDYGKFLQRAIINLDDVYGLRLIKLLQQNFYNHPNHIFEIIGFSLQPSVNLNNSDYPDIKIINCEEIYYSHNGISAEINSPWGQGKVQLQLLGAHNLSNLLASMAVCVNQLAWENVLHECSSLTSPNGRLQQVKLNQKISNNHLKFNNPEQPVVMIDYAHTPAGLANALLALKQHYPGKKICCVFGCGGDRDRSKRPEMLKVAEQSCDVIIITQDNPRNEDPNNIVADVLQHKITKKNLRIIIEPDRKHAIKLAISEYHADYIILIAGKGHETIQIIGKQSYPFSDYAEAAEALAMLSQI